MGKCVFREGIVHGDDRRWLREKDGYSINLCLLEIPGGCVHEVFSRFYT
jgi:hypothetical protein